MAFGRYVDGMLDSVCLKILRCVQVLSELEVSAKILFSAVPRYKLRNAQSVSSAVEQVDIAAKARRDGEM